MLTSCLTLPISLEIESFQPPPRQHPSCAELEHPLILAVHTRWRSLSVMGMFQQLSEAPTTSVVKATFDTYAALRSTSTVRMFAWPMNTSSAEITESRASVPYAKRAVANTVLTASARSAADAQANTTAAVSALGAKRRAGSTTVTVPAPHVRCVASA